MVEANFMLHVPVRRYEPVFRYLYILHENNMPCTIICLIQVHVPFYKFSQRVFDLNSVLYDTAGTLKLLTLTLTDITFQCMIIERCLRSSAISRNKDM